MLGPEDKGFVSNHRFDTFLKDYFMVRQNGENLRADLREGFARLETKLDAYHDRLDDLHARVIKLESFKATMMGIVIAAPFVGGLIGAIIQKYVL